MKTTTFFTRTLHFSGLIFILAIGVFAQSKSATRNNQELLKADQAFARMAEEKNPREAFEFYMADDIIFVPVGETLMTERRKIVDYFSDPSTVSIRWKPLRAEAAKANDLGFTYGVSEMVFKTDDGKTTARYYNYVSVWRKNKKGEWKMIVDMGNSHPAKDGAALFGK